MHPQKFLAALPGKAAQMSEAERDERMAAIAQVIAKKRREAVEYRRASGIEDTWMDCEEAYLGIDDANRHEFSEARWAKPTSLSGPLTSNNPPEDRTRSTAYVPLTRRYVDAGAAKVCEILLPVDDKAFSIKAAPLPSPVELTQGEQTTVLPGMDQTSAPAAPPQGATGQPAPTFHKTQLQVLMEQASASAARAERRIYDWMVEGKYPGEMRKVVHDAAKLGVGVLKGPVPAVKQSKVVARSQNMIGVEIKKTIQPVVKWVDPWNFFPGAGCGENPSSGPYVIERDFLSVTALTELKDDPSYVSSQIDKVLEEGPDKKYTEGSRPNERERKDQFEVWYYTGTLDRDDLEMLSGDPDLLSNVPKAGVVHVIATMVNDTPIRAIPNPMQSGSFCYRTMPWSRRPGHWAGVGVAEQVRMPQRTVNGGTRALLNNAGAAAGVQLIIDELGIIPADGNMAITPNKIWLKTEECTASSVDAAFQAVVIPAVTQELMQIIVFAMKLAEEATGIPLVTQGQTGPTAPQTFGQAELQDNNSHTWLRDIAYRFDDMMTEPLVLDFYEWLLLDDSVPPDEKADFTIHANGSITMVERAIQEGVLATILQAAANPAFRVDPAKTFAEWLKSKRMDPRKIQLSPEEAAQIQPMPPVPVLVEQERGKNALQQEAAEVQGKMALAQQEMAHEQQMLASGGASPHEASAMARIEQAKIHAASSETIAEARANAELARVSKEQEISQQNNHYDLMKLQLQRDLLILEYSLKNNENLQTIKAQLAKTAMQEDTKRQLAAAEMGIEQAHANDSLPGVVPA